MVELQCQKCMAICVGDVWENYRIVDRFGFKVDSSAYISMLCVCAAEGEISDAFQIYEEMLAAGYETEP